MRLPVLGHALRRLPNAGQRHLPAAPTLLNPLAGASARHRCSASLTLDRQPGWCASTPSRQLHRSSARRAASSGGDGGSLVDFKLADIGEGIAECELLKWYVSVGDTIQQFDRVCEVQSDKANVEITSRYDGIVRELKYEVGQLAKVGAPLMVIETSGVAGSSGRSNEDGVSEEQGESEETVDEAAQQLAAVSGSRKVLTSPAVRHLAREHGLDLSQITGTGPNGRLLKEDVLNYIANPSPKSSAPSLGKASISQQRQPQGASQQVGSAIQEPVLAGPNTVPSTVSKVIDPRAGYLQQDVVVPVSGMQRIMVQTMTAAASVPTFGFSDELRVDRLVSLRNQLKPSAEKRGVKMSYLPFIIKAASLALKQFPQVNAHVNADCTSVTHRASHNIGLAMDTPRGLLVPNIKNVQNKSVFEVASELNRLSALGATGKLGKDDLSGGTFTLSNIGSLGGTYMKPILVVPEVVIGAIGAIQTLPRYDDANNVQPTRIMYMSWSGDHRVLDGATMARFSTAFKSFVEYPETMLLETA